MSLVAIKGLHCFPDPTLQPGVLSSDTMDATGERLGVVIPIFKAGNIRNVYFRTATVTEEDVLKISLQGVNSSGVPNGTILGAGNAGYTTATFTDANDNTWLGPYQLGVDVAVTQGQFISIVLEWNSYADGNLNIAKVQPPVANTLLYNMYGVTDITASPGTWAKLTTGYIYCVALEYDDGTYAMPNMGAGAQATLTLNTGTTPDEAGNYVSYPFPFQAVGIWVVGDFDYDVTLSLQASDGTVLANCTLEADYRASTGAGVHFVFFDSDPASAVTIAKNTNYRVVVSPTGADSTSLRYFIVPEAAAMDAFDLGTNCVYTARTDAGAWAQTDTQRVLVGLIGNQLASVTDIPAVGNVTEDDSVDGATGTYHEATTAEVQDGVMFGAGSALEGTYAGGGVGPIRHPGMDGGLNG
jgi:hypothetical protein